MQGISKMEGMNMARINKVKYERYLLLRKEGHGIQEICEELGISTYMYYQFRDMYAYEQRIKAQEKLKLKTVPNGYSSWVSGILIRH